MKPVSAIEKLIRLFLVFVFLSLIFGAENFNTTNLVEKVNASNASAVRVEYINTNAYNIYTSMNGITGKYLKWPLTYNTTSDIGSTYEVDVKSFTGTDNTSATFSGTWSTATGLQYYGGNIRYSTTTNNYAEFTFNIASGQKLGLIDYKYTNTGIAYVTIDGQASLANLLPDDGLGNRYIDQYISTSTFFYPSHSVIPISDSLSSGNHTVRFTVSGLKNASSSATRVYTDGIAVYNSTTSSADTVESDFLIETSTRLSCGGAWEYAYNMLDKWWGTNQHGNDTFGSLVFNLDGVDKTLARYQSSVGYLAIFTEQTTLNDGTHPNVASIQRVYTFSSTQSNVDLTTTWNNPLPIDTGHAGMMPVCKGTGISTIGRFDGIAGTYDITKNDGSGVGVVDSTKVYEYNGQNNRIFSISVTDLDSHANNFSSYIWDVVDPSSYNKIYVRRNANAQYTPLTGEVWHSKNYYRIVYDTASPTAPSLTSPENGAISNQSTQALTWSSSTDVDSGIDHYVVTLDGVDHTIAEGTTTYNTGALSDGTHTWQVKAYDFLNNYSVSSARTFVTDIATPIINESADPLNPNGNNNWYITSLSITLSATDSVSGVSAIRYYWNNSSDDIYSSPLSVPEGTNTLHYYVVDRAGNNSSSYSTTYKVDLTSPTANVTATPTDPDGNDQSYSTIPKITLTATDNETTTPTIYYRWDNDSYSLYSTSLFATIGRHTLHYYTIDDAGNTSIQYSKDFYVSIPISVTSSLSVVSPILASLAPTASQDSIDSEPVVTSSSTDHGNSNTIVSDNQSSADQDSWIYFGIITITISTIGFFLFKKRVA